MSGGPSTPVGWTVGVQATVVGVEHATSGRWNLRNLPASTQFDQDRSELGGGQLVHQVVGDRMVPDRLAGDVGQHRVQIRLILDAEVVAGAGEGENQGGVPGQFGHRVVRSGSCCGSPRSSSSALPRTVTSAPKVQSPATVRESASTSEGGPAGKRCSNASMDL